MMTSLLRIVFHVQDALAVPISGALVRGRNADVGDWAGTTGYDPAHPGDFTADLAPGSYLGLINADGYEPRQIPWRFATPTPPDHPVLIGLDRSGPAPPPTPIVGDAIDLAAAIITEQSPDIRTWPATTAITAFAIEPDGTIAINFAKRNGPGAWPFVMGREGEIQYTLWVGCQPPPGGRWYLAAAILCISRGADDNYVPTGPTLLRGQLPTNWYYFAGAPLASYQPQPGESVAWFVTSGAQRRGDVHDVAERSNVIVAPFAAGLWV